eukprot:TRINITY_DN81_c1_g2_i1.p1 TRINITY_DN81_c1_g2~~TRINITY_DN81_c1_g2_i1.p1  ORF type:complete len:775 (-),score=294.22 TRINITY_DN81_c1_g2_i1:169-2466(-)
MSDPSAAAPAPVPAAAPAEEKAPAAAPAPAADADAKANPKQQQGQKKGGGKKGGKKKGGGGGGGGGGGARPPPKELPEYVQHRMDVWDRLAAAVVPGEEKPIKVTLPSGDVKEAVAWKDSPLSIAKSISQGLAQSVVIAKVNGELYDLTRPLEGDCTLELFKFDSKEGKHVFWHSSSHVLGEALELNFDCHLTIGPALDDGGFYYDMSLEGEKSSFSPDDYKTVEQQVSRIVKQKQPFQRLVLTKEEALELFKFNKYKQQLISEKIVDGAVCTAYRCGPLIDLCRGPHLPHTGKVQKFVVWKNSSSYWKGEAANDSLQRVYGMSFPNKKLFAEWKKIQEEGEARDHRLQAKKQELMFFHPLSPGSAFFLPRGAKLYNKLESYIRGEYRKRGFSEVITPNMYNKDLWVTSGHWKNYEDSVFKLTVEEQEFALKPMNCPGHCLMFAHSTRSYRDLPIRYADFGVLHRNELSGALTGLTRVRRFCQDDAHIFCREDQIQQEIRGALEFLTDVYQVFGFTFNLELSTRPPEKFLGEISVWDAAEKSLEEELNRFAGEGNWKLNPGDGAFYGPKIDIHVFDALKRVHQCATIQLDFQLPIRFDLEYKGDDGEMHRPVIIHRAILGSVERFMAILIENNASLGAPTWPFWLSPRPVMIVPVAPKFVGYAEKVKEEFFQAGIDAEVNPTTLKFQKKIALAQVAGYNYILVVGEKEEEAHTVNVRTRDEVVHGVSPVSEVIARFIKEIQLKSPEPLGLEEPKVEEVKEGEKKE